MDRFQDKAGLLCPRPFCNGLVGKGILYPVYVARQPFKKGILSILAAKIGLWKAGGDIFPGTYVVGQECGPQVGFCRSL